MIKRQGIRKISPCITCLTMNSKNPLVQRTGGNVSKNTTIRRILTVARPLKGIQKYHSALLKTFDVIDLNNNVIHLVRAHSEHFQTASDIAGHLHTDFSTTAQLVLVVRFIRLVYRFLKNRTLTTPSHALTATSVLVMYIIYADIY